MKYSKNLLITGLTIMTASFMAWGQPVKVIPKGSFPTVQSAEPEQDCLNALSICDNIYFQPNSYSGEGLLPNEINPLLSCLSAGERNDVWYSVRVVNGGLLNFTITPVNPADDYDWAVYDLTNAPCSQIAVNGALEVSNITEVASVSYAYDPLEFWSNFVTNGFYTTVDREPFDRLRYFAYQPKQLNDGIANGAPNGKPCRQILLAPGE